MDQDPHPSAASLTDSPGVSAEAARQNGIGRFLDAPDWCPRITADRPSFRLQSTAPGAFALGWLLRELLDDASCDFHGPDEGELVPPENVQRGPPASRVDV
jgi:hypothetical protein